MLLPHLRPPTGHARTGPTLLAAGTAAALLSGCTQTEAPKSARQTQAASAPARLWQEPTQAPSPSQKGSDARPTPLRGVPKVPSGDIHQASWLGIVQAQATVGVTMNNALPFDEETTQKIKRCTAEPRHDNECPVRAPRYRDLNGDGKDELIVGVKGQGELTVWAFMVKDGQVVRILDTFARPLSVEVTGRDVILREPSGSAGYEQRTVYSWNEREQSMALRITEYDALRPTSSGSSSPEAAR